MTSLSKINIGIIGPGRVAQRHVNAIKSTQTFQIVSVTGRTLKSANDFIKQNQLNAIPSDNLEAMLLVPDLHAVIIATPDNLHTYQLLKCVNAGKAILVEKPICISSEEAKLITTSLSGRNYPLMVGYHLRWNNALRYFSNFIQEHQCGHIKDLSLMWGVNFIEHAKWRLDPQHGNWCCLSALGTHLIDVARWLLLPTCGEVISVLGSVDYLENNKTDTSADIKLIFQSGTIAKIHCSLIMNISFSFKFQSQKINAQGDNLAGINTKRKLSINDESIPLFENNSYESQIKSFYDMVIEHNSPEVDFKDAVKNVDHILTLLSR